MSKAFKAFRKIGVLLIGIPVFIIGLILIPLPGPGILVTFLGLLILSLEFEFAAKYRDQLRARLNNVMKDAKQKSRQYEDKHQPKESKKRQ